MRRFILVILALLWVPSQVGDKNINQRDSWQVKEIDGAWWFVSPAGNKEFLSLVNAVRLKEDGISGGGYVAKNKADLPQRVLDYGFKGLDAWSDPELYDSGLPFCKDLNISKYIGVEFILDKRWESVVKDVILRQVLPLKNNPNLIGYYLDNELDWDSICPESAAKYFRLIAGEIRRLDPDRLILGVRVNKKPPEHYFTASNGHLDIHSANIYNGNFYLLEYIHKKSGRPVILSEFSFYSNDGRSGNKNNSWRWGGKVENQSERGKMYRGTIMDMASRPYMAGASWFQWSDQPPSGRIQDGEDVNFGVVDIYDEEYKEITQIRGFDLNKIHMAARN